MLYVISYRKFELKSAKIYSKFFFINFFIKYHSNHFFSPYPLEKAFQFTKSETKIHRIIKKLKKAVTAISK